MKWLWAALAVLLLALQYPLWWGQGGVRDIQKTKQRLLQQQKKNDALRQKNQALKRDIKRLNTLHDGVEENARERLGLVKKGEHYYRIIERKK